MRRYETLERWAPVLLVYLGMLSFLFCLVFWAVTSRLEPLLLGAGGTLMGLSQGLDAYTKSSKPLSPSVPDTTDKNGNKK